MRSGRLARIQTVATRLRFVLAVPAAAALVAFADRVPMWPGVAVALAGEAVQIWASAHLHKNVAVVKSGPYAWTRNPMYIGRFFVGLGLTLLTWRWFFVVAYGLVFALYAQARVLGEEKRLSGLFGEEYADYCRRVNRWLPRPPRGRLSAGRGSWAAVLRNHELRVAGALLATLALLRWRIEAFGRLPWGP